MSTLQDAGPFTQLRAGALPARLVQLLLGLALYGWSLALMVRGGMGVAPWAVLDTGIARHAPLSLGGSVIAVSVLLLVAVWPWLGEKPGLGTLLNAVLVGVFVDLSLVVLPAVSSPAVEIVLMVGGVVLNGVATGLYIGAAFGRGARDGVMTGIARRTGRALRPVRTAIELAVLLLGVALGGSLGVGTVVYALAIGPLVQLTLPWFDRGASAAATSGARRQSRLTPSRRSGAMP
ncbi:membrane protein YczE [Nocardioides acrostichi]|uniref:Membrane protein YczE n=1 Tax=Nocardioides acrostichi TaxID=2784339 RepID=A0A930UZV7_9ACTN|nr:hypothetical protein [Nocardioides acrostichi]MBF4161115.1 hypothetical protein [Nocardioides acrostichi]